jgi:tetratricopeptide (TPR) repeat protein
MRELRQMVLPRWSDARARRVEAGLKSRLARRREARLVAAAALVAVALAAFGLLRVRGASVEAPAPVVAEAQLKFSDGSVAEVVSGGEVRALAAEPGLVGAELVKGAARFEVVKDPSRRFRVKAGPVTVEVIGTRFLVERQGASVKVNVERGLVRVAGPGVTRLLRAGESVTVAGDGPEAWLAEADAARAAGRPAEAVAPLRHVIARRDDARAPLAAFTLGRVLAELGRMREAAEAFAQAREIDPRGELAGDALAREAEAWAKAGEPAKARARALEYLRRYPEGQRLSAVKRFAAD